MAEKPLTFGFAEPGNPIPKPLPINILRRQSEPTRKDEIPENKRNYVDPNPEDILCRRGFQAFQHPGNQHLRARIYCRLDQFQRVKGRAGKTAIIRSVIAESMAHGARFLTLDKNKNRWYDGGISQAKRKVGIAFRDASTPGKVKSLAALRLSYSEAAEEHQKNDRLTDMWYVKGVELTKQKVSQIRSYNANKALLAADTPDVLDSVRGLMLMKETATNHMPNQLPHRLSGIQGSFPKTRHQPKSGNAKTGSAKNGNGTRPSRLIPPAPARAPPVGIRHRSIPAAQKGGYIMHPLPPSASAKSRNENHPSPPILPALTRKPPSDMRHCSIPAAPEGGYIMHRHMPLHHFAPTPVARPPLNREPVEVIIMSSPQGEDESEDDDDEETYDDDSNDSDSLHFFDVNPFRNMVGNQAFPGESPVNPQFISVVSGNSSGSAVGAKLPSTDFYTQARAAFDPRFPRIHGFTSTYGSQQGVQRHVPVAEPPTWVESDNGKSTSGRGAENGLYYFL